MPNDLVRNYLIYYKKKGRFIKVPVNAKSEEYSKIKQDFARVVGAKKDEFPYAEMVALYEDQKIGSVYYKESLAGSSGMAFNLLKTPDVPLDDIQKAIIQLRSSRDVVDLYVTEITEII